MKSPRKLSGGGEKQGEQWVLLGVRLACRDPRRSWQDRRLRGVQIREREDEE
jgi:hypothetical protein